MLMRHEAAYFRKGTLARDLAIAAATFAATAALVIGVGLWTHYVTGTFFTLTTAILAWHSGFRPALLATALSTAAIGPLVLALDRQAAVINMPVRLASMFAVSLVVSWLCGNLYRAREALLVEQRRLQESEGF